MGANPMKFCSVVTRSTNLSDLQGRVIFAGYSNVSSSRFTRSRLILRPVNILADWGRRLHFFFVDDVSLD